MLKRCPPSDCSFRGGDHPVQAADFPTKEVQVIIPWALAERPT